MWNLQVCLTWMTGGSSSSGSPVFDKGLAQIMITVLKLQVKIIFDIMLHNVLSLALIAPRRVCTC